MIIVISLFHNYKQYESAIVPRLFDLSSRILHLVLTTLYPLTLPQPQHSSRVHPALPGVAPHLLLLLLPPQPHLLQPLKTTNVHPQPRSIINLQVLKRILAVLIEKHPCLTVCVHVQYLEESSTSKIKLLQLVLRDVHLLNPAVFAQGQGFKLVALQINKFKSAVVLEAEFLELVIGQPQFLNNIALTHLESTQFIII